MALTSVFYDGPVTETSRAQNRAGAPDYGVYGADDFKVITHPSIPYALTVKAGKAHGHGITDTPAVPGQDQMVQCATLAGTGAVRYDLIVVRRNWQPLLGGPSTLAAIQGGSTVPNIQALRRKNPGIEDDQPIALVKWQGNQNTPTQNTDLRCWAGNGGMIAANTLALEYLARPGADVLVGADSWRYVMGSNGVWGWVNESMAMPLIEIGQGINKPILKSGEVRLDLNSYLVADIVFPTPFPNKLVSIDIQRRHTTAGPVTFTVVSGATNNARAQVVASGGSPGLGMYVTYQAWGY